MTLSEICIKRPVLATVLSLVIVVIGLTSFYFLHTRYLPEHDSAIVRVIASYSGASAALMEQNVTTPLEKQLSGISGIETLQSTSAENMTLIKIRLSPTANPNETTNAIRNKVAEARGKLPPSMDPPMVTRGWDDTELMDIVFSSKTRTPREVRDILQQSLIDPISDLPGVANVNTMGASNMAMRIRLNPLKMKARGVSIDTAIAAIQNNNLTMPAGSIHQGDFDLPITTRTTLDTPDAFNHIPVATENNKPIHISDIGHATLGSDTNYLMDARINNTPAIDLQISSTTDANPIKTARLVLTTVKSLMPQLPDDIQMTVIYNQAEFMAQSVHDVYVSLAVALACVAIVIFLFLGSLKTVIIPIITIPICLIGAFSLMAAFGFTLNLITLLALVLAIGLVVDDAIVVLENCHRHMEKGTKPYQAAVTGAKEIFFPIVAMTLTLVAVYAPIGLMHSHSAILFRSFAYTLAGSVLLSGFVAITLTPTLCARMLSLNKESRYSHWLNHAFSLLSSAYQKLLCYCMQHKITLISVAVLIMGSGLWLFQSLPKQFIPPDDQGMVMAIINTPTGSNENVAKRIISSAENIIRHNQNVMKQFSIAASSDGFNAFFLKLKPFNQRKDSAETVANQLNTAFSTHPGLSLHAFPMTYGGSNHDQLEIALMTSDSYDTLYKATQSAIKALTKYPGIKALHSSLSYDSQQINIHINRTLADNLGISAKSIDSTIAAFIGGEKVSTFNKGNKSYNVYVQAQKSELSNLANLNDLTVYTATGKAVPLTELVTIQPVTTQPTLTHYNHMRSATLSAQLGSGYTLGDVVAHCQQVLPRLLNKNIKFSFTGKARKILTAGNSMNVLFGLALVFIFLVLAAQFESFKDPCIILFAVPFSIIGALILLKITGGTRNLYTDIGLITLIGLIAKHGILITQFANNKLAAGVPKSDAIIQAATIRLRPILMTTLAMIFGAMPLLFASGASQLSREQIGLVIVGGLCVGTVFSLILVPILYDLFKKDSKCEQ